MVIIIINTCSNNSDKPMIMISFTIGTTTTTTTADHRENFNQFVSDFQPLMYGRSDANWGIEGRTLMLGNMEEANVKVRRYSMEERKDRIMKYLKKRNQRNFNKTIKYACRKTLADRRIRVRGRFARNNEVGGEEVPMAASMSTTNININQLDRDEEYYDTCAEIKEQNIGEEWLQDAVTSLMYLPIFAG
ncbi:hypothetical protein Sjap_026522 [Stephania japonica]|uniref:CCT domain-containing protein n=1 Tax=Stephania japonica TaxID=461633 RepID=A0AAP0E3T2_9MAGN